MKQNKKLPSTYFIALHTGVEIKKVNLMALEKITNKENEILQL